MSNEFNLTNVQLAYLMGRDKNYELGGVSTHVYYEIKNNLDVKRFEEAFNKVIDNQPMLRTVIEESGVQKTLEKVEKYHINTYDLSDFSKDECKSFILNKRESMSHHIFKSDEWPLFQVEAACLDNNELYMFFSFDLLIADGSSLMILIEEIMKLYKNPEFELEPLKVNFKDYVLFEEEQKNTSIYKKDKEYWQERVKSLPLAPDIPIKTLTNGKKTRFKRLSAKLEEKSWDKIKKICLRYNLIPTAVLCSLYAKVLERWSSQKNFSINLTMSNRQKMNGKLNNVIGDFTSTMIVEVNNENNTSDNFIEGAKAIQNSLFDIYKHNSYDGFDILKDLARVNNMQNDAVMPIVFTSLLGGSQGIPFNDVVGKLIYSISQTPQIFLDCQVIEVNKKLSVTWDYVEDAFSNKIITEMFEQYFYMIKELENESISFKKCLAVSREDERVIEKFNKTDVENNKKILKELVTESMKKYSSKLAVKDEHAKLSYEELDALSDEAAFKLSESGIGPGDFVGVKAERCVQSIVNIIGVIKSGAAYIPISPDFPEERQRYILSNSKCRTYLKKSDVKISDICSCRKFNKDIIIKPNMPAYVIYTSGSTGVPKGVVISNEAVCNTLIDVNKKFNITSEDKVIGISSFCFDLSVYDIFGTIAAGAMVYIAEDARDIVKIYDVVLDEEITVWNTVPAIMELYVDEAESRRKRFCKNYWELSEDEIIEVDDDSSLQTVMLSGDYIPLTLPDRIKQLNPYVDVYSLGGATEAAIWSNYFKIKNIDKSWTSVPYGYPLSNQSLYVLNKDLELCPIGVTGELYIGGKGVALYYLNDKEKTYEAFINNEKLGRIYRTGDYAVFREEGFIEFKGRRDQQIKIRGHRIELSEIEQVLLKDKSVENVVVTTVKNTTGSNQLCAYIKGGQLLSETDFRNLCEKYLPDYMVPNYYVKLDEIPLTANGKVNKKLLPDPASINRNEGYVKPRNNIEKSIAEIWAKVLSLKKVGVMDNYFELGGDSVSMVKIVSAIENEMHYKISLKEFLNNLTVKDLALCIGSNKELRNKDKSYYKKYEIDTSKLKINNKENNLSDILLTGATGFLGTHILRELLLKTKSNIYCLIRNEEKFYKVLKFYFGEGFYADYRNRIKIVKGDVSKNLLGLDSSIYEKLVKKIGSVYHTAASVKHFGSFDESYKINTIGTLNAALLCAKGGAKLYHMSTRMVSGENLTTQSKSDLTFNETCFDIGQRYWENIYVHSKFLAEKMLFELSRKGLKVKIFRIGNLSERDSDGLFQINADENVVKNTENIIEDLNKISDFFENIYIEKTPVDKCAQAIFLLSQYKDEKNIVYHVYSSKEIRCLDYFKTKGYEVDVIPHNDFMSIISEKSQKDGIYKVIYDYLVLFVRSRENGRVKRDNTYTNEILNQYKFQW